MDGDVVHSGRVVLEQGVEVCPAVSGTQRGIHKETHYQCVTDIDSVCQCDVPPCTKKKTSHHKVNVWFFSHGDRGEEALFAFSIFQFQREVNQGLR